MDWMRRNWPDLVIAIALVAVIAGIVLTLITGGTLFPLGGGTPRATPDASAPRSIPAPTGPSVATDPETPADEGGTTDPVISPLPPIEAGAGDAAEDRETNAPVAPAQDEDVADAPAPAAPTQQPAAAPTASTAEGSYRVSVGAFGNPDNAERLAATFRDEGFPVFIGTQGDLSLVLVGPYDTEAQAEQAADRVRAGDSGTDPVIYRFRSDEGAAAAPPPARAATPAAADGRFVQVGAYGTADVAQPQRERLEALGYAVSQRSEGGLVKLLIGPFAGDELAAAQARLESEGIDHFIR